MIVLATQGSQGIVALRELFSCGVHPQELFVVVCNAGANKPLFEFLKYNEMTYITVSSDAEFRKNLDLLQNEHNKLVSVSWKYKFSEETIDFFNGKTVNFHPGLLPEYKGCFSTPWAIINHEKYSGYTYHRISEEFDSGNILLREKIEIYENDTSHSLNYRIMQRGLSKLPVVLEIIDDFGIPQEEGGSYYSNVLPYNGIILNEWTDSEKIRFARAMYFPPHKQAVYVCNGSEVEVDYLKLIYND